MLNNYMRKGERLIVADEYSVIFQDLETLEEDNTEKEYISILKKELDESGILMKHETLGLKGKFSDKIWAFEEDLSKTYLYCSFDELDKFRIKGLGAQDIVRIKAYLAYCLLENGQTERTVRGKFSKLIKFIELSNFFDEEKIFDLSVDIESELKEVKDSSKVDEVIYNQLSNMFDPDTNEIFKRNKKSQTKLYRGASVVICMSVAHEYLEFVTKQLRIVNHVYNKYIISLQYIMSKYQIKKFSRTLPDSVNILKFHNYIDTFFSDDKISKELKLFYKPIQIWWKLTNIIPMRPSEFTTKLERNCILTKDGNYYIKINRIKDKFSSRFPIKKEFRIDDRLANIILDYIKDTKQYGETETLFSYNAYCALRDILYKEGYSISHSRKKYKINNKYFTLVSFRLLLSNFYKVIIEGIYDDKLTCQICPGDTRHFAFFSLLMQGIPPIEIALLGGHSNIQIQLNYQNCIEYYIGTELYEFLFTKNTNSIADKFEKNINEVINRLPAKCPKPPSERLELKIGYCLCDFSKDVCDEVGNFHCFCSKWWGEPTRETYNKLKEDIENELKKTTDNMFFKLSALEELLAQNYWSNARRDNKIDAYVDTKTCLNQLKNDCDNIIGLKMSVMSKEFIQNLQNRKKRNMLNEC